MISKKIITNMLVLLLALMTKYVGKSKGKFKKYSIFEKVHSFYRLNAVKRRK